MRPQAWDPRRPAPGDPRADHPCHCHASGRRIALILRKANDELDEEDYAHMRKVVGFVRRHLAQRPENVVTSRWRYSLMNWGHDPLKD